MQRQVAILAPTLMQLRVQQYIFFGPIERIHSTAFLYYSSGPLTEEELLPRLLPAGYHWTEPSLIESDPHEPRHDHRIHTAFNEVQSAILFFSNRCNVRGINVINE